MKRPPRIRFRFKIRTVLLLTALVAAILATGLQDYRLYRRQSIAYEKLRKSGCIGGTTDQPGEPSWLKWISPEPFSRIESLRVTGSMSQSELDAVAQFPWLSRLDFTDSNTGTSTLQWDGLRKLSKLESLNLLGQPVDDSVMQQLAKLQSLRALNIADTNVTDDGVRAIAKANHVRRIVLNEKNTDRSIAHLLESGIEEIDLRHSSVSAYGLSLISPDHDFDGAHSQVRTLGAMQRVRRSTPEQLKFLRRQRKLDLSRVPLTDSETEPLSYQSEAFSLTLNCEQMTTKGLAAVRSMESLAYLKLINSRVTVAWLVEHLRDMPHLFQIHVWYADDMQQRPDIDIMNIRNQDYSPGHLHPPFRAGSYISMRVENGGEVFYRDNDPFDLATIAVHMPHVDQLIIDGPGFDDRLPEIAEFPELTMVRLRNTKLSEDELRKLPRPKSLKLLTLENIRYPFNSTDVYNGFPKKKRKG